MCVRLFENIPKLCANHKNIIQAVEVYQLLQYLDMFKKNSTTAGTRIFYYHPTKCHIHFNINVFKTPL